ncbi:unnamed protein product [Symbiodinium sp. KB8]|nr:unnamed protein product [Symbiodinium sp. KB8]
MAHSEGHQDDQLLQAQAEFAQFGAYMKAGLSQPGSTGALSTAPSLAGTEEDADRHPKDMEVDKDRRRQQRDDVDQASPQLKWAKGENKGSDKPVEPSSGKGGLHPKDSQEASTRTPGTSSGQQQESQERRQPGPSRGRDKGEASEKGQEGTTDRTQRRNQQQGQGWYQQHGYRSWPTRRGDREDLKEVVKAMGRLSLRLEDQLSVLSLDVEFILFLQTDAAGNQFSITASLYAAAQQWHKQKSEAPDTLNQPMRNILLHCLFSALLERLEKLETDSELMTKVKQMGLVEGETYVYLQWDASQGKHIRAQDGANAEETAEVLSEEVLVVNMLFALVFALVWIPAALELCRNMQCRRRKTSATACPADGEATLWDFSEGGPLKVFLSFPYDFDFELPFLPSPSRLLGEPREDRPGSHRCGFNQRRSSRIRTSVADTSRHPPQGCASGGCASSARRPGSLMRREPRTELPPVPTERPVEWGHLMRKEAKDAVPVVTDRGSGSTMYVAAVFAVLAVWSFGQQLRSTWKLLLQGSGFHGMLAKKQ